MAVITNQTKLNEKMDNYESITQNSAIMKKYIIPVKYLKEKGRDKATTSFKRFVKLLEAQQHDLALAGGCCCLDFQMRLPNRL